jgi:hypothetical protein
MSKFAGGPEGVGVSDGRDFFDDGGPPSIASAYGRLRFLASCK